MKIRINNTDKHYYWFTQFYQLHYEFEPPSDYEHCQKLWKKWCKSQGLLPSLGIFLSYKELAEDMDMFLIDIQQKEDEARSFGWAVDGLLRDIEEDSDE
jgi:hypothetical protein